MLFNSNTAPTYHPGLRAVLAIFVALAACVLLQLATLVYLNRQHERERVRNGKPAKMIDHSMQDRYHDADEQIEVEAGVAEGGGRGVELHRVGEKAFLDLTDRQNDEFIYIY